MHLEKRRRGLLLEAFRSEGEGSSSCKPGGGGVGGESESIHRFHEKNTCLLLLDYVSLQKNIRKLIE